MNMLKSFQDFLSNTMWQAVSFFASTISGGAVGIWIIIFATKPILMTVSIVLTIFLTLIIAFLCIWLFGRFIPKALHYEILSHSPAIINMMTPSLNNRTKLTVHYLDEKEKLMPVKNMYIILIKVINASGSHIENYDYANRSDSKDMPIEITFGEKIIAVDKIEDSKKSSKKLDARLDEKRGKISIYSLTLHNKEWISFRILIDSIEFEEDKFSFVAPEPLRAIKIVHPRLVNRRANIYKQGMMGICCVSSCALFASLLLTHVNILVYFVVLIFIIGLFINYMVHRLMLPKYNI